MPTGTMARAPLPPEIIAQQKQRRARTLRLYGLAVAGLVVFVVGILVVYGSFQAAIIATNQRFGAALARAGDAYAAGQYSAAERDLHAAMHIEDGYNVRYDLGLVLLHERRYTQAIAQLGKAISFARVPTAYLYAAIAALDAGQPAQALDQIKHALKSVPYDPDVNGVLGLTYRALGRVSLANQAFATARTYGYSGLTLQGYIDEAQFEGE